MSLLAIGVAPPILAQSTPVGAEIQVNTVFTQAQEHPAIAYGADGRFVVVWESYGQDGANDDVFFRRFDSSGQALGGEVFVNGFSVGAQDDPSVAIDGNGGFVVVWTSNGQDGALLGVFGRRFSAAGARLGVEFQVAAYTPSNQSSPSIAMRSDGDFVVGWSSLGQDGSELGVFARRFTSTATAIGAELQVNAYTTGNQAAPALVLDGTGGFVVVWESTAQDGALQGVFASRFSSSGARLAQEFQVNLHTTSFQRRPAIGIDPAGDFVVAWQSLGQSGNYYGLFARRFASSGAPLAAEFQIETYTTNGGQRNAAIGVDSDGDFVITWTGFPQMISGYQIRGRRFDAGGTPLATEFQVNPHTFGSQQYSAIGMSGRGDFVVTWDSPNDGNQDGVFAQRFTVPRVFDIDGNGVSDPLTDGLLFLRYLFDFRGATLISDAVAGNCSRCTQGPIEGYVGDLTAVGRFGLQPEFQVNNYTTGNQRDASIAAMPDGFVIAWNSPQDGSSYGVFGRRFDPAGVPLGSETQINGFVTDSQRSPAVGADGDGDFVVVWESNLQDGALGGIFGRRFASSGSALGVEFQVALNTSFDDQNPSIAVNATGASVVAWDGSSYVFARRFTSAGSAVGLPFLINNYQTGYQGYAGVGIGSDGAFVVVWQSDGQDGDQAGVFARRFNSTGNPSAAFLVNTFTPGAQFGPVVTTDISGGFVVAWTDNARDGGSFGVFAARFDAIGSRLASEFQVNDRTIAEQGYPKIAKTSDGDFVVAWDAAVGDGSSYGVFARRFRSSGTPIGGDFQVNSYATNAQRLPAVTFSATGDLLVAWHSNLQDGSSNGVFARRYAGLRAADIDGNGIAEALTDGLLLLRYLFDFRGAALVSGAVDLEGCTRCTAEEIESYIGAKV